MDSKIVQGNRKILALLSEYINFTPDAISCEMIEETKKYCHVGTEEAYRILISGIFDIYNDKEMMNGWIRRMFKCLDPLEYENDPYRRTVRFPTLCDGEWELFWDSCKPYEAFVYNDLKKEDDGRIIPQIGFFEREYKFPTVRQRGREWMLITPNEIETMKAPIREAFGNVVTYGLGLGYFAFMTAQRQEVRSVTVVERDESVIRLFEKHLLWQFPNKDKIRVIHGDAFEYAREKNPCDFVFADIWHDPSDGVEAYLRLKALETCTSRYAYWIEDTLKLYL